ncbi:MAG: hypothetical protein PHW60_10375, partial [Kiritimatiellae bacterium]|nr:hypothetical protein [Kiritimatiellia bacterium]
GQMTIQNQKGQIIIRYENAGTTKAERKAIFRRNLDQFEKDAHAGKLICLSDLIGQAEAIHIENIESK